MNKAAIASLLTVSAFFPASCALTSAGAAFAQTPNPLQPAGQVTMDAAEYADYDNALNKQTTPQTQAPALEAYLAKYPKSSVKNDMLVRIMIDYSQFDHAKAITAADAVIAVAPTNLQAYVIEVAYRREAAEAEKDPATKQSDLDAAAGFATKGLEAAKAPKPADMTQAQYDGLTSFAKQTFYSTIGEDALNKKDGAAAVAAFKAELAGMKPDQLTTPAALQETYYLGQAYYVSNPPDYVNCTFYTTRAAALAPDQFKPQLQPLASYCYKKFHGGTDGYDAVVTAAKATPNPPADFKIVPAPTDEDIVNQTIASTPDLATLALSDKEFILQHGKQADADKVFDTIKGKSVQIPGAVVVAATADQLQVAVSDDAVQANPKYADYTFNRKTPLKTVPAVGDKIDLNGTYASYTQKPLMITMSDGEEVTKKPAAPAKKPVRRTR
jgi:hypothetical protein